MWIKEDQYNKLQRELSDCKKMKVELEREVHRLSALISAEVKDCCIGGWCDDCKHKGQDSAERATVIPLTSGQNYKYIHEVAGKTVYCKKHLQEICPEFEMAEVSHEQI